MGLLLSRTLEIQITNRTQNITLRNPRTYFESGSCSKPPLPELFPGCIDTSHFENIGLFCGIAGVLVYESDCFTLAIHFCNPFDYNIHTMELGLELSLSKAHLRSLDSTYARMAKGTYSSSFQDAKFNRVTVGKSHGTTEVSDGLIKVMAIMSNTTKSTLKVILEEQGGTER